MTAIAVEKGQGTVHFSVDQTVHQSMHNLTNTCIGTLSSMAAHCGHEMVAFFVDPLPKKVVDIALALGLTVYAAPIAEAVASMNFVDPSAPRILQIATGILSFGAMALLGAYCAEVIVGLAAFQIAKFTRQYVLNFERRLAQ